MQYLVYRAEGNLGPFTLDELRAQVAAGTVQPADLAWHDGLAQWEPVSNFVTGAVPAILPSFRGSAGDCVRGRWFLA
jgi:hypothetical protein